MEQVETLLYSRQGQLKLHVQALLRLGPLSRDSSNHYDFFGVLQLHIQKIVNDNLYFQDGEIMLEVFIKVESYEVFSDSETEPEQLNH